MRAAGTHDSDSVMLLGETVLPNKLLRGEGRGQLLRDSSC